MTSDTRPAYPVTPVTATPSRRHTHCDGSAPHPNCPNPSCDGCDGYPRTPSHPSPTALPERSGSLAGPPVTRPRTPDAGLPLAPLALPTPPPTRHYTVTPIDTRGRLADRSPIRILSWQPCQPITITTTHQAIVVTAHTGGPDAITRQGHLRLPARIRHSCHLNPADRLLVATAPTIGVLVVYPTYLLESILQAHHATTREVAR